MMPLFCCAGAGLPNIFVKVKAIILLMCVVVKNLLQILRVYFAIMLDEHFEYLPVASYSKRTRKILNWNAALL